MISVAELPPFDAAPTPCKNLMTALTPAPTPI
jgi:hypothetical protein